MSAELKNTNSNSKASDDVKDCAQTLNFEQFNTELLNVLAKYGLKGHDAGLALARFMSEHIINK